MALVVLVLAGPAHAQTYEPGFLDALGRWFQGSAANLRDAGDVLSNQAKDATETVVRLPRTRIVSGRFRCEPAANGAPDCPSAADALCRVKGLRTGRSVDIETSQDCPARTWMEAQRPAAGGCRPSTYVTRAICQ